MPVVRLHLHLLHYRPMVTPPRPLFRRARSVAVAPRPDLVAPHIALVAMLLPMADRQVMHMARPVLRRPNATAKLRLAVATEHISVLTSPATVLLVHMVTSPRIRSRRNLVDELLFPRLRALPSLMPHTVANVASEAIYARPPSLDFGEAYPPISPIMLPLMLVALAVFPSGRLPGAIPILPAQASRLLSLVPGVPAILAAQATVKELKLDGSAHAFPIRLS